MAFRLINHEPVIDMNVKHTHTPTHTHTHTRTYVYQPTHTHTHTHIPGLSANSKTYKTHITHTREIFAVNRLK